ncbi:MAG: hypothetical protein A2Z14_17445 [Chloroflexi bacterium RBG_16_48_8]|nr:MAG: hypothetical protein A2Z14_17445 [Chloroflexi bacterium RBG_16_48_8]
MRVGHQRIIAPSPSAHTDLKQWWELFQNDNELYHSHKRVYMDRILSLAERAIPGLRDAAGFILAGRHYI